MITDIIYYEILAEHQRLGDNSHTKYLDALYTIKRMLEKGVSIRRIKKYIKQLDINSELKDNLERLMNEQSNHITGADIAIGLGALIVAGYTFKELVKSKKEGTYKALIRFMAQAKELLKDNNPIDELIENEHKKYKNQIESFYRSNLKKAREYAYAENDKKLSKEIQGWISIAVLDNRTSAICASLHNEYYPKSKYKNRFEVPNPPPRHPNCYDKHTRVYTQDGFKYFKDVKVGDMCLTFSPQTQNLSWEKVINTFKKYEEKIWNLKSKTVSMGISQDHPMIGFVRNSKNRKIKNFKKWENVLEMPKDSSLYVSSKWDTQNIDFIDINGKRIKALYFARFMALYLSDGHYDKDSNTIVISNTRNQDKVIEILNGLNIGKVYKWKSKSAVNSKELYEYVKKLGNFKEKYIPKEIKSLNKELLIEFLEAYLLGDGHQAKDKTIDGYISRGSRSLFTTSEKLRDDLVEVIIKSGQSARITEKEPKTSYKKDGSKIVSKHKMYIISILRGQYRSFGYVKKDLIDYNDFVYDVEVEKNHTLLTERNGYIVWGSNCRSLLVPVWKGTNIDEYRGQNIETFLRKNPDIGKDMLGIKKYKLFETGKAKIKSYVDIKGHRWYRNDEIIQRLGIKSKDRLNYVMGGAKEK
jgi:hypothetical protein